MKIEIQTENKVVPKQSLEGKKGYVARIGDVRCYQDAEIPIHCVRIDNISSFGSSVITYTPEEMKELMESFGVKERRDLKGKLGISVYDKGSISGIIPLELRV